MPNTIRDGGEDQALDSVEPMQEPIQPKPVSPEVVPEYIPTPEEVHVILGALVQTGKNNGLVKRDGEPKETKRIMNENGLYELEIEVPGALEGEMTEYAYRRFPAPNVPDIHVTYYKDGMPVHGTTVAKYVDGAWKFLN